MDSPASSRGRNRSAARKRHSVSIPSSSSHHFSDSADPQSLSNTQADEMPASSYFTFETPSPSNQKGTRKRGRPGDGFAEPSPDDPESRGGRSLRKRTRIVDYGFDQLEDEETDGLKSAPIGIRSARKRKSDAAFHDDELDEEAESRTKRRASEQPPHSAPRRRGPYKRSTISGVPSSLPALPAYLSDPQVDNVEVRDTIEVGGHHSSQSDETSQRRASSSSPPTASSSSQQTATQDTVVVQEEDTPQESPIARKNHGVGLSSNREPILKAGVQTNESFEAGNASVNSKQTGIDPLEHLTPYIEGAITFYPTPQEEEPDPEPDVAQEDLPSLPDAVEDVIETAEVVEDETPTGTPRPSGTQANSPAAGSDAVDVAPTPARKQFPYKQIRPASEFTELLSDIKSLSPAELYRRLEIANGALVSWQGEYNKLRYITDDEDNAQRYKHEEALFQHRKKMAISKDPDANPVQKDFVLKGIRAPKQDPLIAYAKQQDRIMANAYLFEYDDRESKIGRQDPIAQRAGIGKGRLRDRPKQTAKAAEADDGNVVLGKRTRKAPVLFDGGEATSRGSTPVPAPVRRRRRAPAGGQATIEENGDVPQLPHLPSSQLTMAPTSAPQSSQPDPAEPETPRKKARVGKPRKPTQSAAINNDQLAPTIDATAAKPETQPQPQPATQEKRIRKRRRKEPDAEEGPASTTTTITTNHVQAHSHHEELPRPHTADSTATVSTVASNYQLREKRRTNFSSFDDFKDVHEQRLLQQQEQQQQQQQQQKQELQSSPQKPPPKRQRQRKRQPKQQQLQLQPKLEEVEEKDEGEKTPRPKRVRRAPKKIQSEDFAAFHESMPTLAPAPLFQQQPTPGPAAPAVQLPDPRAASSSNTPATAATTTTAAKPPTLAVKPPTRIKIKHHTQPPAQTAAAARPPSRPSPSDAATPSTGTLSATNGTNTSASTGTGADSEGKDYNDMTKSEKMSRSMKGMSLSLLL